MPRSASPLVLRNGDRQRLLAMTRSPNAPEGLSTRARIVLLAAEDQSNTDIARRVGVTRQTVVSWRERYEAGGISALKDVRRPGRPPVHDEIRVVAATLLPPPAELGVSRWTSRVLAEQLGLSFATVARLWRKWNLQPWQVEAFAFATDPELGTNVADVLGLHLHPELQAAVVRLAEPEGAAQSAEEAASACSHLSSLDETLSEALSGGQPAAGRRRDAGLLAVLKAVARDHPRVPLQVLVNRDPLVDDPQLEAWLARNRRIALHATSTTEEWLTILGILFGIATHNTQGTPGCPPAGDVARNVDRVLDTWPEGAPSLRWVAEP